MISNILSSIIASEFEKRVGRNQHEEKRALHLQFALNPDDFDKYQYRNVDLYLFAPHNYVYVVAQEHRITSEGKIEIDPMKFHGYHDSCWRDSLQGWVFQNRDEMSILRADSFSDWCSIRVLTDEEIKYLSHLKRVCYDKIPNNIVNPFEKRIRR